MQPCNLCGEAKAEKFAEKYELNYVKCRDCGFVYADTDGFDFVAANEASMEGLHDRHIDKREDPKHIRAYAKLLKEFEPYKTHGRLLEVGCSAGGFLSHAKRAGWQEVGVEPVEASARYAIDQLGLNVHIGTLDDVDIEPESIDVVYSNAVIEHVEDPAAVIAQAVKLLRPGGLFYADTVNLDSYTWQFLGERWKLFNPRVHLSMFTPETLRSFCERAGLRVCKVTTHGVRFTATRAERPRGLARFADEMRKAPYSWAARRTLKGDNMAIYAEK